MIYCTERLRYWMMCFLDLVFFKLFQNHFHLFYPCRVPRPFESLSCLTYTPTTGKKVILNINLNPRVSYFSKQKILLKLKQIYAQIKAILWTMLKV